MNQYFSSSRYYAKAFILDLLEHAYEETGFEDSVTDPHLTQLLRVLTTSWACHFGYQSCVDNAAEQFQAWIGGNGSET